MQERDTSLEMSTGSQRDGACAACRRATGAREPTGRPLGLGQVPQQRQLPAAWDDGNTTGAGAGEETERESEKTAWGWAPLPGCGLGPGSPFSDPPRYKRTYSYSPGRGRRGPLASPDDTGVTIHTGQKGQEEEESRFPSPGQCVPDGARTHRAPIWKQTFVCDKIYASGQEGWTDVPTPPSWRLGALVLRSDRQALLSHDGASY